jgi:cell shape-determining protein MreD
MRTAGYWFSALAAAILQATYLAGWRPLGIVPGLALIVIIRAAVLGTASRALIAAVLAGLPLDLVAGDRFGFNTTFLVVVVLAVAWLRRGGTVFGIGLELLAVVAASIFQVLLTAALLVGHAGLPIAALAGQLLLTTFINLVLAFLIYIPLGVVMRPLEEGSFGQT